MGRVVITGEEYSSHIGVLEKVWEEYSSHTKNLFFDRKKA